MSGDYTGSSRAGNFPAQLIPQIAQKLWGVGGRTIEESQDPHRAQANWQDLTLQSSIRYEVCVCRRRSRSESEPIHDEGPRRPRVSNGCNRTSMRCAIEPAPKAENCGPSNDRA